MITLPRHQCIVYEGSPSRYLQSFALTMIGKLKSNHRCMYLNSPVMVLGMRSYLFAKGLDVDKEVEKGSLILTSDQSHLVDGVFDVDKMIEMLDVAVRNALLDGYNGLWATGDMTWEFGDEKNLTKLLEYEHKLEEYMQNNVGLSGVCQYHSDTLPHHAVQTGLISHKAIFINETLSQMNPAYHYAT